MPSSPSAPGSSRRHVSLPQPNPANGLKSPRQLSTKSHETGLRSRSRLRNHYTYENDSDSRAGSIAGKTHPLQKEIDRLTAACDEHERKIRVAKATIEHRLFSEWPQMLSRLNEADDQADQMTTQIHAALQSTIPAHQSRLDNLLQARKNDAQQVKERTTTWKSFFATHNGTERERSKSTERDEGVRGRINRVDGVVADGDGLSRIERWAEEVEMYFTTEVVRLRTQLNSMSWRRRLLFNILVFGFTVFLALFLIGAASLYLGEKRHS